MRNLIKYIAATALLLTAALPIQAQDENAAFYIYQNDGHFDGFFYDQVQKISYSKLDTLGVEHEDFVSQEIITADSTYRIMLTAIDSVSFVQPEIKFAKGVRFMRDEGMMAYYQSITKPDDDSFLLRFSGSMPTALQPKVGDVLSCPSLPDYEEAFVGKVKKVRQEGGETVVECGYVDDFSDVFEQFITVEQVRNIQTPEGSRTFRRMAGMGPQKRAEGNFEDITLFNFSTTLEGNISVSNKLKLGLALNVGFGMTASAAYKFTWDEKYIKVSLKDQIAAGATLSLDGELYANADLSEIPGVGKLVEMFSRIPFPANFPILYAELTPQPFTRAEAHLNVGISTGLQVKGTSFFLELKNKWPYVDMGINFIAPFLPYEAQGEKSFSVNAQINGFVQSGMKFPIVVGTQGWIKNFCSLKAGTTVYAGPKISGALNFDIWKEMDGVYESMKDSKVDLSLMSIDTEIGAEGTLWNKKTETKTTHSWTFGNYALTLFPNIENTEFSLTGEELNIVKCKYDVAGDVFLPQTLGVGLYVKENENSIYYPKLYKSVFRDETYFLNTFNNVDVEIPDVEPGEYRLRPIIRTFNGIVPVNAEEKVVIVEPNELILKPDMITAEEEGGEFIINLVSKKPNPITASTDDKWITTEIIKPSANQKYYTMKVKAAENNTDAYRTGTVKVRQQYSDTEYDEKILTVKQYGGLQLPVPKIEFSKEGGDLTIDILTSYQPITVDLGDAKTWLSYSLNDRKLTIKADPNQGGNRTAIIIISAWDKKRNRNVEVKLIIIQKGVVDALLDPKELSFEATGGTERVNVTVGPNTEFNKVEVRNGNDNWVLIEKAKDHFYITAIPSEQQQVRTAFVDATFTSKAEDGKTSTVVLPVKVTQEGADPGQNPTSVEFSRMFTGAIAGISLSNGFSLNVGEQKADNGGTLVKGEDGMLHYHQTIHSNIQRDTTWYVNVERDTTYTVKITVKEGDKFVERDSLVTKTITKSELQSGTASWIKDQSIDLVINPTDGDDIISKYKIESGSISYFYHHIFGGKTQEKTEYSYDLNNLGVNWICDEPFVDKTNTEDWANKLHVRFKPGGRYPASDLTPYVSNIKFNSTKYSPLPSNVIPTNVQVNLYFPKDYPFLCLEQSTYELNSIGGGKDVNIDLFYANLTKITVTTNDDWIHVVDSIEGIGKYLFGQSLYIPEIEDNNETVERTGYIILTGITTEGYKIVRRLKVVQKGSESESSFEGRAELPPTEFMDILKKYMPIYEGDSAPDLGEKVIEMAPTSIAYANPSVNASQELLASLKTVFKFGHWLGQNTKEIDFSYYQSIMDERYQASEPLTFGIWGANGNFTMGYTRTAEIASTPDAEWQYNAKYLISFVVSGTVTSNGIKDMYFAQINQSQFNGNAPETSIIIYKDEDGLSTPTTWNPGEKDPDDYDDDDGEDDARRRAPFIPMKIPANSK